MLGKTKLIRTIYVYLFSLVGLVLIIIAAVRFIDMGLKAWVFTEADSYIRYEYARTVPVTKEGEEAVVEEPTEEEQEAVRQKQVSQQRQRDASNSLAMLIVGLPLYLYHWRLASRRREDED